MTRKTGTTAKKATAKSTSTKSTARSTGRTSLRTTARSTTARAAKKAAPIPPTATKQRPNLVITTRTSKIGGSKVHGGKTKGGGSPYEVRVGDSVVPIVPFRIEALIQHVGSVTEAADLLGVAKSQPTRWRKGEAVPSPEKARLLNDLEHVFSRAAMIFEGEAMRNWMTGPNRYLGGRPIDVLRERGASEVLDALDVAEQIAFGG